MTCPRCGAKGKGYRNRQYRKTGDKRTVVCNKCNITVWIDGNKEKELRTKGLLK